MHYGWGQPRQKRLKKSARNKIGDDCNHKIIKYLVENSIIRAGIYNTNVFSFIKSKFLQLPADLNKTSNKRFLLLLISTVSFGRSICFGVECRICPGFQVLALTKIFNSDYYHCVIIFDTSITMWPSPYINRPLSEISEVLQCFDCPFNWCFGKLINVEDNVTSRVNPFFLNPWPRSQLITIVPVIRYLRPS